MSTSTPPSFAVIVPAFEAEKTIGEAIESALGQTLPAARVIVCDDGSADRTAAVAESFGDRVTLIRQQNRGPSAARNAAIDAADTDWVVNLDADDTLLPRNLAARAELLAREPDLEIIATDGLVEVDGVVQRNFYGPSWSFETADQRRGILERCFIIGWGVRRRSFLAAGGFDPDLTHAEDWECFIRMILGGARAGFVDEPQARYRLRPGSLSNQAVALQRGHVQAMRKTAADDRLTATEREGVLGAMASFEADLRLARLREAVLEGGPAARAEARKALRRADTPPATRAKAGLALIAPGLARRVATRRGRETGAGVTLPVE
jgi:cellulose synthase/poly-beta-1,6-N-acetylglucosamine synthase-like glycosyltransferase